jgi:hypothetical protein
MRKFDGLQDQQKFMQEIGSLKAQFAQQRAKPDEAKKQVLQELKCLLKQSLAFLPAAKLALPGKPVFPSTPKTAAQAAAPRASSGKSISTLVRQI